MAVSTDAWLRVLVVVIVVGAIATLSNRTPGPTPAPTGTAAPAATVSPLPARPTSSTNIPGGPDPSCHGELIATATDGGLTLQVYYADDDGGRNCAVATKTGDAAAQAGELVTTLQLHSYDGRRWPRYAIGRTRADDHTDGIYLEHTNHRCVRGWARFSPDRGRPLTVATGKVGCR